MRGLLRCLLAAAVATLIVAGTETVASYPSPTTASGIFFAAAFLAYLPPAMLLAWAFAAASPTLGLNLWFPLFVGALRMVGPLAAAFSEGHWRRLMWMGLGLVALWALRRRLEFAKGSPPFLFGVTVGVVLPILMARVASGFSAQLGGRDRALPLGAMFGLLGFVFLRAFVARWPRVAPLFLLGPVVSLWLWARQSGVPGPPLPLVGASPLGPRRPDIVLVVLDTLRASALASYGNPHDTMPALDRFALTATRFEHAWANGSWTLPSHASLFSGLRLSGHRYDSGFDPAERSSPDRFLAERLRRSGYATGAVVANFGVFGREDPLLFGFEGRTVEPLRPYLFRPFFFDLVSAYPRAPWLRAQAAQFPSAYMRAPWVVDRALAFWSRPEARPKFLFVNLMEAHLPWVPGPEDLGRFGPVGLEIESEQEEVLGRYLKHGRPSPAEVAILRARYEESVRSLDRSLARLLRGVASGAGNEETIVVVTADHGESLGEHDRFGHRTSLDEEATRIPLIIRGPGVARGTSDAMVQLTDIFGYLARAAGIALEPGLDALPLGERREAVIEHRPGRQAPLPPNYPRGDLSALIVWPYKYLEGGAIEPVLFDLASDPGEMINVSARTPARRQAMSARLREISASASSLSARPDPRASEQLRALGYVR